MIGLDAEVRRLVGWHAPPETLVLSLYLDLTGGASAALAAAREALTRSLDDPGDARAAALLGRVNARWGALSARARDAELAGYAALATFHCAAPSLESTLCLRFPVEARCDLGRDPFLRQVLIYAEEYESTVCVVLGERVTLCEVSLGDLTRSALVVPTHGRSEPEEVNAALYPMVSDDPKLHVVVLGPPERAEALLAGLSDAVRERVIDRVDEALAPTDPRFLPCVHRCLQAYERRAEATGVARLLRARDEGDAVALGLRETLTAINQGRIATLYVLRGFRGRAWLCDACDRLGEPPTPPVCVVCGATVTEVPVEEHLLDQAAACGAEVETVLASDALAEAGGVGAWLQSPRGAS
ncbi:MAG: hypothetical protein HY909_26300 [Deltaproteobacteria bacterium]|nr:hypothetical protein [Deltaproteobacteria bacterium]